MRPSIPLIDKEKVCEVALHLIAKEGIDALTIRRIAAEIGVNGASLYHHFHNKHEIIVGAAELALSKVRVERFEGEPWDEWVLRNVRGLFRVLREHPDLIPVLIRRHELQLGFKENDFYFAEFERQGLEIGLIWPLTESLQAFAIGMVMQEHAGLDRSAPVTDEFPALKRATEKRLLNTEEAFDLGCQAIIGAVADESRRRKATKKRPARKAAAPAKRAAAPAKRPARSRAR